MDVDPYSEEREAGGPAGQGQGPVSLQANRSCWWAGAELICTELDSHGPKGGQFWVI